MKLRILSDLHLEYQPPPADILLADAPDVYVLAGDVAPLGPTRWTADVVGFLQLLCARAPVVYVPGNHEAYGCFTEDFDALWKHRAVHVGSPDFHPLRRERIVISGQGFAGATLYWKEPVADPSLTKLMRDYREVRGLVPWAYAEGLADEAFLQVHVEAGDVVVTHLMPSIRCVAPKYKNSATNHFFVREMDDLIRERRPALWVHGHTHEPVDVTVGETRIVCNPLGYPGERQAVPFAPAFTVEI